MVDLLLLIPGILLLLFVLPFVSGVGYMYFHRVTGRDPFNVIQEGENNE